MLVVKNFQTTIPHGMIQVTIFSKYNALLVFVHLCDSDIFEVMTHGIDLIKFHVIYKLVDAMFVLQFISPLAIIYNLYLRINYK
jgi:hypothetical protein